MGEKVAIVGSRKWPDWEMVRDYIYSLTPDDTVVSGGARGPDEWAEIYARELGLDTLIFRADWASFGKRAGIVRNRDIVNSCDRLVAFWDGKSAGTKHSIDLARAAGKPVLIFRPPENHE